MAQICPFHSDEFSKGKKLGDGSIAHRCDRTTDHPTPGAFEWLEVPEPSGSDSGLGGHAAELGLDIELPAALATLGDGWFEYGLVERAYALRRPDDFRTLLTKYGHKALGTSTQYSVSAFLAKALGDLSRHGSVAFRYGKATGPWAHNETVSYWSRLPVGDWERRQSWDDSGADTSYLGATPTG